MCRLPCGKTSGHPLASQFFGAGRPLSMVACSPHRLISVTQLAQQMGVLVCFSR